MANPRRNSYSNSLDNPFYLQILAILSSLKQLLKKPHALPFLLLIFLFLTWVFLRFQQYPSQSTSAAVAQKSEWSRKDDENANLFRFDSGLLSFPSPIIKDRRGWLLDPVSLARDSGIKGGALSCASIHVGEIRPGGVRGNHRHNTCNETFVIWGAKTLFRLENHQVGDKGYAETIVGANEVAVAASPSGTAHLLVNMDSVQSTFFIGCQDGTISYNASSTDFNVWKDI